MLIYGGKIYQYKGITFDWHDYDKQQAYAMTTPQYLTVYLKDHDDHKLCVLSEKMTLLGYATLTEYEEGFLEVNTAVARPGMGTLLYQNMAKYAGANNKHIMPDRSGDTRSAVMVKWQQLYDSLNDQLVPRLPDHLNEGIVEVLDDEDDDVQCLLYGYAMPADPQFMASLKHVSEMPQPNEALRMMAEGAEWFTDAYGQDSNAFIDKNFPYLKDDPKPEFPRTLTLPFSEFSIGRGTLLTLLDGVRNGQYSRSEGNVTAVIDLEGHLIIDEGHHRFIEQLMLQKREITITLLSDERLHGREYDLCRPNKAELVPLDQSTLYSGLEAVFDIHSLYALTEQYCRDKNTPVKWCYEPAHACIKHLLKEDQRKFVITETLINHPVKRKEN